MIGRLRHLDHSADVGDGLALDNQLLSSFGLADDLLRRVTGAFDGQSPGQVLPDEDSHSPWRVLRGPHHVNQPRAPEKTQLGHKRLNSHSRYDLIRWSPRDLSRS